MKRELKRLDDEDDVPDEAIEQTMQDVLTVTELLKWLSSGYILANPREQDRIAGVISTKRHLTEYSES